ncbi:hypothetical protein WN51_01406 [Melipona quadrifasciata]|uniref:Uncharacterized protein n=1 Tax=Melipona quadrifasciata TaxID=166423 RepID=A0A0N0U4J7_9HYME|nr:hypothetical protein WN51_01406 [Melipona quadrifasciata]
MGRKSFYNEKQIYTCKNAPLQTQKVSHAKELQINHSDHLEDAEERPEDLRYSTEEKFAVKKKITAAEIHKFDPGKLQKSEDVRCIQPPPVFLHESRSGMSKNKYRQLQKDNDDPDGS